MSETRRSIVVTAGLLLLHFSLALVGQTQPSPRQTSGESAASDTLLLQIRLDRAGFSPGEIDGQSGANTDRAIAAYSAARGHHAPADRETMLAALGQDGAPAFVTYTITADDADGPFTPEIPDELMAQARLQALEYRDIVEALAERFHVSRAVLQALNPATGFAEGDTVRVPNVVPHPRVGDRRSGGASAQNGDADAAVEVVVSRSTSSLTVRRAGQVIMHAPATTGSEHDPLPLGDWTVVGVSPNPEFHYNPDLFWDAEAGDTAATIPPGPNGPVGVVWVDLSKEHYGIHGTPEPGTVGHTASHGCVRLTNWDAARLAALVGPGTPVRFVE